MADLKIAVPGVDYYAEQSTTQFAIPAGAGATFSASGNIATITTNAAHGLTFSPSANVLPNFFIQPATSSSGLSGTGILVGNVFRILSIPTTTTFTIWTTVTAATVTATTFNPVFFPVFIAANLSGIANLPSQNPWPWFGSAQCVNLTLGANVVAQYNPDNTMYPQDPSTNLQNGVGTTLGTAPTMRTLLAASSGGQLRFGPQDILLASGTTATSRVSIVA